MTDISHIGRADPLFPADLWHLVDPPKELFFRGQFHLLQDKHPLVGIVGTRRADPTGRRLSRRVGELLAQAGCTVVSGLALGIDAEAHHGALKAGGHTVAVLGSGLADRTITPQQHLGLAQQIAAHGGLLLSEYPPTYPAGKYTYPARNRIIAALVSHLIVIQAPVGSGALITVDHALQLGKSVAAFPGPSLNAAWAGTNQLLQQGAEVLCEPEDALQWLGLTGQQALPLAKNPEGHGIIELLLQEALSTEELVQKSGKSVAQILHELSSLELAGQVWRVAGKWTARVQKS
ncbi:MAG: DNA-processing protein DprA [Patescibacteria group bacterium]